MSASGTAGDGTTATGSTARIATSGAPAAGNAADRGPRPDARGGLSARYRFRPFGCQMPPSFFMARE